MEHKALFLALLIGFSAILFVTTSVDTCVYACYDNDSAGGAKAVLAHAPHNAIVIVSDEDFELQGWSGNGTKEMPYIIQDLSISTSGVCIAVYNTTSYFEIRHCILSNPSSVIEREARGVYLNNVTNAAIMSCEISRKGTGLYLEACSNCVLKENEVELSWGQGTYLGNSQACVVMNNQIHDNPHEGIYLTSSINCNVSTNTVHNQGQGGIRLVSSSACLVFKNDVHDNSQGIVFDDLSNSQVVNNTVRDSSYSGFSLYESSHCNVSFNNVTHNAGHGAYLWYCSSTTFSYNLFLDNADKGVHSRFESWGNMFFGNEFGWNLGGNAFDDGSSNTWDDAVDSGNLWSNYNGVGTLPIPGAGGGVDRYPSLLRDEVAPTIEGQQDFGYELGSDNNYLIWVVSDGRPDAYRLVRNGTVIGSGDWDGSNMIFIINGLPTGTYNFSLTVYDVSSNAASDTTLVTVVDTTPPKIVGPSDIQYECGTWKVRIEWAVHDLSPDRIEILHNGTSVFSSAWNGGNVAYPVGGAALGAHNYTLIAYDAYGNSASDTVMVEVVDTTAPWIDCPGDIVYEAGTTGNNITWHLSELNPDTYEVSMNGSIIQSDTWVSKSISITVDGLDIGTYLFSIVVTDKGGNQASDDVIVRVKPGVISTTTATATTTIIATITATTTTTTTITANVGMIALGLAGGGVAVLVIVVVAIKRRP